MTSVSALDINGDWTFGSGRANYKRDSDEVKQSVVTRIRCFYNDWFLDVTDGIDWYGLLGKKGTQGQILREVEKRVLMTAGVRSIEKLEVLPVANRVMTINLRFTTIFDDSVTENLKVSI